MKTTGKTPMKTPRKTNARLISVSLSLFSSLALGQTCPNFSGVYSETTDDGRICQNTFVQNQCDSLNISVKCEGGFQGAMTLPTDGKWIREDYDNGYELKRNYFANQSWVQEFEYHETGNVRTFTATWTLQPNGDILGHDSDNDTQLLRRMP